MEKITGNESAFPDNHDWRYNTDAVVIPGLTIRQYFAGLAMQGYLSGYPSEQTAHPTDNNNCMKNKKYNSIQEELLSVREFANALEKKNKVLEKKLLNLKARIKNLYYSLSD